MYFSLACLVRNKVSKTPVRQVCCFGDHTEAEGSPTLGPRNWQAEKKKKMQGEIYSSYTIV